MKIISDHNLDVRNPHKKSGGYEWWYFDGWDKEKDLGFVIIFYDGNPFSTNYIKDLSNNSSNPTNYPGISISIYKDGKPIYYSFTEVKRGDALFGETTVNGSVLKHNFSAQTVDEKLEYILMLEEELPSGDSINAELVFRSNKPNSSSFDYGTGDDHLWNLIQANATIRGFLEVNKDRLSINGQGYHDHNMGNEPMDMSFRDWYWGRFHFGNKTLLYYIMNHNNETDYKAWLIDQNHEVIHNFTDINYSGFRRNFFGLSSARVIELRSEQASATIQLSKVLDNGPFYQRFKSQAVLQNAGNVSSAEGVSEYIYPLRIKKKVFWPLVKMRIYELGKPHWVQKSSRFYRWTW